VNFCPVQSAVRHLNLDEMTLKMRRVCKSSIASSINRNSIVIVVTANVCRFFCTTRFAVPLAPMTPIFSFSISLSLSFHGFLSLPPTLYIYFSLFLSIYLSIYLSTYVLLLHAFSSRVLTILELSEFVAVFAEPKDLRTVKAAARCLKASVSGPPPATSKSCLSSSIEAYVFPEPLVPAEKAPEIFISEQRSERRRFAFGLTGKDNCLRIAGLRLLSHGLLHDLVQLRC